MGNPAASTSRQNGSNSGRAGGAPTVQAVHRTGLDERNFRAALEQPGELALGGIDLGEVDDRGGEHPVLVVEAPVLVNPLVERVDDRQGQGRVIGAGVLYQAARVGG